MSGLRRLLDTVRALWPFKGEAWVAPSNSITRMLAAGPIQLSHIGLDDIPVRKTALPPLPALAAKPTVGAVVERAPAAATPEAPARPGRAA